MIKKSSSFIRFDEFKVKHGAVLSVVRGWKLASLVLSHKFASGYLGKKASR